MNQDEYCHQKNINYNCGPCEVQMSQNVTVYNHNGHIQKGLSITNTKQCKSIIKIIVKTQSTIGYNIISKLNSDNLSWSNADFV